MSNHPYKNSLVGAVTRQFLFVFCALNLRVEKQKKKMDLIGNMVYPKGKLFSSIYGLNKTYSKKSLVGLEYDEEKRLFAPKVR